MSAPEIAEQNFVFAIFPRGSVPLKQEVLARKPEHQCRSARHGTEFLRRPSLPLGKGRLVMLLPT